MFRIKLESDNLNYAQPNTNHTTKSETLANAVIRLTSLTTPSLVIDPRILIHLMQLLKIPRGY